MEFLHSILIMHHLMLAGTIVSSATPPSYISTPPGLTNPEQSYYELSFNYAMDTVPEDKVYEWKTYSGDGSFRISKAYVSPSGYLCRNFSEAYRVQGKIGSGQGAACKRNGDTGWCKLRLDNALTCAMEPPGNTVASVARNTTESIGKMEGTENYLKGMIPW